MPSETFTACADQSLEELRRELAEAREQQAATAEILRVISNSPMNLTHVFAEMAASAARFCDASDATIHQVNGDLLPVVAHYGSIPAIGAFSLVRGVATARAVLDQRTIHVADLQAQTYEYPEGSDRAQRFGFRTILAVPLIRAGEAIGVIAIRRIEVRPFSDQQIDLLKTFADQAVIAIENARLFEAAQASKRELQESLEYQMATSDVLSVISKSPHPLQPVFDAIIETAARLCKADYARFRLLRDGAYHVVARLDHDPDPPERHVPIRGGRDSVVGRVAIERSTIHIPDVLIDPTNSYAVNRQIAARTILGVPLLKQGEVVGIIMLFRDAPRPFSARQVALVETFANQALIAIENTRLFEAEQARTRELTERTDELTETLEFQTATGDVLSVISRSPSQVQPVFDTIAQTARRLCEAERASIWQFEGGAYRIVAVDGRRHGEFEGQLPQVRLGIDRASITGRVAIEKRVVHVLDLQADPELTVWKGTHVGSHTDFRRTMLGVPLLSQSSVAGVIILARCEVKEFSKRQIDLVSTFADQAVIAIENARLFEEVQARTHELARTVQELEIASQHKSQFVANMSHELRTPLAAILGYAELIQEGFYGTLPEKSTDALTRIRSNGKHLLGLINTVLDIAKIESGQFTLNMAEYAIESVVETVRSATESLAQNKKLALKTEVAKSLPVGLGDEQRLTQVLLNLVGNAIKFTDTGEVCVIAKAVNGHFNVSVTDTGPGIPEEHQARIFEQFHQVDASNTKAKGGTGLGLAIAREIVEMHGGRIWVESTLGKGSTFQMELPTRAEFRKTAA